MWVDGEGTHMPNHRRPGVHPYHNRRDTRHSDCSWTGGRQQAGRQAGAGRRSDVGWPWRVASLLLMNTLFLFALVIAMAVQVAFGDTAEISAGSVVTTVLLVTVYLTIGLAVAWRLGTGIVGETGSNVRDARPAGNRPMPDHRTGRAHP